MDLTLAALCLLVLRPSIRDPVAHVRATSTHLSDSTDASSSYTYSNSWDDSTEHIKHAGRKSTHQKIAELLLPIIDPDFSTEHRPLHSKKIIQVLPMESKEQTSSWPHLTSRKKHVVEITPVRTKGRDDKSLTYILSPTEGDRRGRGKNVARLTNRKRKDHYSYVQQKSAKDISESTSKDTIQETEMPSFETVAKTEVESSNFLYLDNVSGEQKSLEISINKSKPVTSIQEGSSVELGISLTSPISIEYESSRSDSGVSGEVTDNRSSAESITLSLALNTQEADLNDTVNVQIIGSAGSIEELKEKNNQLKEKFEGSKGSTVSDISSASDSLNNNKLLEEKQLIASSETEERAIKNYPNFDVHMEDLLDNSKLYNDLFNSKDNVSQSLIDKDLQKKRKKLEADHFFEKNLKSILIKLNRDLSHSAESSTEKKYLGLSYKKKLDSKEFVDNDDIFIDRSDSNKLTGEKELILLSQGTSKMYSLSQSVESTTKIHPKIDDNLKNTDLINIGKLSHEILDSRDDFNKGDPTYRPENSIEIKLPRYYDYQNNKNHFNNPLEKDLHAKEHVHQNDLFHDFVNKNNFTGKKESTLSSQISNKDYDLNNTSKYEENTKRYGMVENNNQNGVSHKIFDSEGEFNLDIDTSKSFKNHKKLVKSNDSEDNSKNLLNNFNENNSLIGDNLVEKKTVIRYNGHSYLIMPIDEHLHGEEHIHKSQTKNNYVKDAKIFEDNNLKYVLESGKNSTDNDTHSQTKERDDDIDNSSHKHGTHQKYRIQQDYHTDESKRSRKPEELDLSIPSRKRSDEDDFLQRVQEELHSISVNSKLNTDLTYEESLRDFLGSVKDPILTQLKGNKKSQDDDTHDNAFEKYEFSNLKENQNSNELEEESKSDSQQNLFPEVVIKEDQIINENATIEENLSVSEWLKGGLTGRNKSQEGRNITQQNLQVLNQVEAQIDKTRDILASMILNIVHNSSYKQIRNKTTSEPPTHDLNMDIVVPDLQMDIQHSKQNAITEKQKSTTQSGRRDDVIVTGDYFDLNKLHQTLYPHTIKKMIESTESSAICGTPCHSPGRGEASMHKSYKLSFLFNK